MRYRNIILLILIIITFAGCTPAFVEVRMNTNAKYLGIKRLPLKIALVIPEEVSYYLIQEKPSEGKGPPHIFKLGEALEKGSLDVFSQISEELKLVRSTPDFKKFGLAIEPRIKDFFFGCDDSAKTKHWAVEVWCNINIEVKVYDRSKTFWKKTLASPVMKQGVYTTFLKQNPYESMGEVASEAMKSVLRDAASHIVSLPEIKEIVRNIEEVKEEDGEFE